ncbi:MAG TPA: HD domain-containing phosphohydrolase [Nitrospira sp.]|nr:HD domain-containing phosphohydrolase [Nitrospira sp.]
MCTNCTVQIRPAIATIQSMLKKIDRLTLSSTSRHDLESILVRQVTKELDRLLPWQAGHGEETAALAHRIGQGLHLSDEALHQLRLASLLHDIGLLMLPARLQKKQAELSPDSYVTIQNHPRLGATLLEPFLFLREATVIIAHHHEQWDGSGYPYGLRGEFIPLGARILAIADAFQAIAVPQTPNRSLRDRIALRIMQVASGTQFDPLVVDALVELIRGTTLESITPYHRRTTYAGLEVGGPTPPTFLGKEPRLPGLLAAYK